MKSSALSLQNEHAFLQRYLQYSSHGGPTIELRIEEFCQQYRDLNLGPSFLSAAHSTKWLDSWKDGEFNQGRRPTELSGTLQAIRSWTGFLFDQGILDDDAFFYLDVRQFLNGHQSTIKLDINLQSLIRSHQKTMEVQYKPETLRVYLATLHDFNKFQATWPDRESDWVGIESQRLIEAWIRCQIQRVDAPNAAVRLGVVRELLEILRSRGLIANNPADLLRKTYPRRGWRGIAAALGAADSAARLEELASADRFISHWGPCMVEWIRLKRSLGLGFKSVESTLAQLDRYLKKTGEDAQISSQLLHMWLTSLPETRRPRHLNTKLQFAKNFFDYAIRQGHLTSNPADFRCSKVGGKLPPHIYTTAQIQEILRRAKEIRDIPFFLHRGATYATMLAIIYCLGLRVGEACRLCLEDVDLEQSLVRIQKTKFYKSRILPIGPKVRELLARFLQVRRTIADAEARAPFFLGRYGRAVSRRHIGYALSTILKEMGLHSQPGHRPPCLHSFRHTFALHRLIRWYREGANVQLKLPLLSAYLGHVDIASTQIYLEANFDLLEAANERFESRFGRANRQQEGLI